MTEGSNYSKRWMVESVVSPSEREYNLNGRFMDDERQSVDKYMDDGWYSVEELWMVKIKVGTVGSLPQCITAFGGKEGG